MGFYRCTHGRNILMELVIMETVCGTRSSYLEYLLYLVGVKK